MEIISIHSAGSDASDDNNESVRNICTATLSEFCGTFMFLLLAFSATQIADIGSTEGNIRGNELSGWYSGPRLDVLVYISLAFGISLAVNVWIFYRVSGGMFNPIVSLALNLVAAISFPRTICVIIAQFVASIAAAGVTSALFPGPLRVSTRLGAGTSITQGLFIEMFLTALLVVTYIMLGWLKHRATFLAPLGVGLAGFITHLSGVYFTGASLNPARSLGPDAVVGSFPGYHWIYWVGPSLGGLLAVGLYFLLHAMNYETCSPGQDADGYADEIPH
ncbi:hypothetical protein VTO42DRAFT_6782 [Malbranchea cinnamomea]